MVVAVCGLLLAGYPVALTLAGVSLLFAAAGAAAGLLEPALLGALPERIFGVMSNDVLLAIPLFIFMGVMLERSHIAEELLETMGRLFGALPGGLGLSVIIVGVLLAAAKGIVGATAVTMGLIALPTMLRHGYDKALAAGTVAATATLAQIFPPATVLCCSAISSAIPIRPRNWRRAISRRKPSRSPICSPARSFPGFVLVLLYMLYLIGVAIVFPEEIAGDRRPIPPRRTVLLWRAGSLRFSSRRSLLILAVLGSILGGVATPTEAASVGAVGAILLAARKSGRRGPARCR